MILFRKVEYPKYYSSAKRRLLVEMSFYNWHTWKIPHSVLDSAIFRALRFLCEGLFLQRNEEVDLVQSIGYRHIVNYLCQKLRGYFVVHYEANLNSMTVYRSRSYLGDTEMHIAQAIALDKYTALSKSLGESLERYFVVKKEYTKADLVAKVGSFAEMQQGEVSVYYPHLKHGYSDEQKQNSPHLHKSSETLTWSLGEDLISGRQILLPTQLLSIPYQRRLLAVEGVIHECTTNGAAGWFTKEGAARRAIFELIQRDSIVTMWLTKCKSPVLARTSVPLGVATEIITYLEEQQLSVVILLPKSIAEIPTVVVGVFGANNYVRISAHADVSLEAAIEGALFEMLALLRAVDSLELSALYIPFLDKNINKKARESLLQNADFVQIFNEQYRGEAVAGVTYFREFINPNDEQVVYGELLERLQMLGQGYEPVMYTYKDEILDTLGFWVVKCFVPNLLPFYLREDLATIKSERVTPAGVTAENELQIYPHPFI